VLKRQNGMRVFQEEIFRRRRLTGTPEGFSLGLPDGHFVTRSTATVGSVPGAT
jgi:hypothetical protein